MLVVKFCFLPHSLLLYPLSSEIIIPFYVEIKLTFCVQCVYLFHSFFIILLLMIQIFALSFSNIALHTQNQIEGILKIKQVNMDTFFSSVSGY